MEEKTSVAKLTVDSINKIPLILIMEHSPIPFAIKDTESRFVYINHAAEDFLDLPIGFDFEGLKDDDVPHPCSEFSEEIRAQDRKAEKIKDGAEIIITSSFGRNHILEPYYSPKFPIYDADGNVLGTFLYQKKFRFISICEFFNNLKPSVVSLNPPVDTFTEKDLDVIFYAIQKLSSKEIGKKLCLSHRTIENRLQDIYGKIGVNSLGELIEYCHSVELHNYVPKKLLREGVEFFW